MDRIATMSVFVAVAECGSFTGGARRLRRSPAAVTRAVAELEAALGVRLLDRTTRAVSLTNAGERFLPGARRLLADLAEIEQTAAGLAGSPRGELRVTAPIVFGRRHVLPLVSEFLAGNPDVTVRLELTDRPVDLIEEGLDVAVRIGELPSSTAIATRVGTVRRVTVAAPAYLARRGEPATPDGLAAHDVIAFAGLDGFERWRFRDNEKTIEAVIRPRMIVNTAEAAIDVALTGFGITRVFSYQAADLLAGKSLMRLLRAYESEPVPVHLLYPQGRYPAPKLRAFLDLVTPRLRRTSEQIAAMLGDEAG
ncbi:LysR family transcriptional regulator [Microbacteriaceae bacterium K1510]|nr:LysR family transcriptional regulator [Microbacteriaceae bacterium K1510]